jgi:hypothetical protein
MLEAKKGNSTQSFVVEKRLVLDVPVTNLFDYFIDKRLVQQV